MSQLEALAITLAVELAVAFGWFAARGWLPRADWWRGAIAVIGASLVTHPLAWRASTAWLRGWSFPVRAAIIELAVALIEAAILAIALRIDRRRALIVAVTMNAASFAVGLLRYYLSR